MAFDWEGAANGEGAKMPEGYHRAIIAKVARGNKDGTKIFTSKNGDAQLMVIWENDDREQATTMCTLSTKAGWVLANICKHVGMDLKRMQEAGVEPQTFEDETFARKQLEGRKSWVYVKHDGKYANAETYAEEAIPVDILKREKDAAMAGVGAGGPHEPIDEGDIPF